MSSGRILHLQRLSTEDGPGIRTTVFFKGCPLSCAWCHNPESISPEPQLQWFPARCLRCGACAASCPESRIEMREGVLRLDREKCRACGRCSDACPSGALESMGKSWTVEALLGELSKDAAYFEKSGGGVTLSGGEPSLQSEFAGELLRGLKARGVSTALDTCGMCSTRALETLLPHVDLVLFDVKLLDPSAHRRFTGAPNEKILENLLYVRDFLRGRNGSMGLWIRTPLIPGATMNEGNLSGIGRFLAERLDGAMTRWELCAFNNLCRDQYARLGLEWDYAESPLLAREELSRCERIAKSSGVDPGIVFATGATRSERAYEERP